MARKSFVFCVVCMISGLRVTYAASPVLTLPQPTVTVEEKQARRTVITDELITCSDTVDNEMTRAYVNSMTPNSPCTGCFALALCGDMATEYCLEFRPSQGSFVYTQTDTYRLSIVCTDDTTDAPATGVIQVIVKKNEQPVFTTPGFESVTVGGTKDKGRGAEIFTVDVTDTEGDALFFTMTTIPDMSDLFEIEYGSGIIRAKKDLKHLCSTPVTFEVYVKDSYNARVGPKHIQANFEDRNLPPQISNTEAEVLVAEDVKGTVVDLNVQDATIFLPPNALGQKNVDIYMTTQPAQGVDIYEVVGTEVRVRNDLNYEYEPLRQVDMTLQAFDAYCYSDVYSVRVIIEDVNEPFEIIPDVMETTVNEGSVSYSPDLTIRDPDANEGYTYQKLIGASSGTLDVDGLTALVTSNQVIKADSSETSRATIKVQVTDKGANTNAFTVDVTLLDINDNTPVFNDPSYTFDGDIDDCTELGTVIGKVRATDQDSKRNGNNLLVFSGGGQHFSVLSDGTVLYTNQIAAAYTDAGSAYVTDMGTDPGPLEGASVPVTVVSGTCPTTTPPPPTTQPPTTPPPVTTTQFTVPKNANAAEILKAPDTSSNTRKGYSESVSWMTVAAVTFVTLIILSTLVTCRLCKNSPGGKSRKPAAKRTTFAKQGPENNGQPKTQLFSKSTGPNAKTNPPPTYKQQAFSQQRASILPIQGPNLAVQQPSKANNPPPPLNGLAQNTTLPVHDAFTPTPYDPQPENETTQNVRMFNEKEGARINPFPPLELNGPARKSEDAPVHAGKEETKRLVEPATQPQPVPIIAPQPNPKPKTRVVIKGDHPSPKKADKTSPRKPETKKADQAKAEPSKAKEAKPSEKKPEARKPDQEKPGEPVKVKMADFPSKPKMQIGESFDLDIITPRNSPLPFVQ